MNETRAHMRGIEDAKKDRSPLFRRRGAMIVPDLDDEMADEWDQDMRQAYLDGYYSYQG